MTPRLCNPLRVTCAQVALPELDGGLEPIVFAGRDSNTGKSHSLPDRIDSLCARSHQLGKVSSLFHCISLWSAQDTHNYRLSLQHSTTLVPCPYLGCLHWHSFSWRILQ